MRGHIIAIAGYVFSTLLVQATSHFAVNTAHYAAVAHNRAEPVFALGISSMIVQGAILSWVYSRSNFKNGTLSSALQIAWLFGAFLASYMALAEAAKYTVPDIASWITVEILVAAVQFTLIGCFLWAAHREWSAVRIA